MGIRFPTNDTLEGKPLADTASCTHPTPLLNSVLTIVPDGLALIDTRGEILLCNPPLKKMIDLDQATVPLEDWPQRYGFFRPDTLTLFPAAEFPLLRAVNGEASQGTELFLRNVRVPEGLRVDVSSHPLKNETGEVWGGLLLLRDITPYRRLEKEILDVSGREQQRIGQELHDGLCQILTGIKFMCNASLRRLADKTSPEADDWTEIQKLVSQALREADTVAKGLYPVELEENGLVAALKELAAKTRKLYRISCVFLCDQPVLIGNPDVALHMYRIVQEAIVNAVKHGQAKNIMIWLAPIESRYSLMVKNDGPGPAEASLRQGMGWRIMNNRAEMIGASLRFEHEPGGGAVLTCDFQDLPLANSRAS